jgi:hypothetical protein
MAIFEHCVILLLVYFFFRCCVGLKFVFQRRKGVNAIVKEVVRLYSLCSIVRTLNLRLPAPQRCERFTRLGLLRRVKFRTVTATALNRYSA